MFDYNALKNYLVENGLKQKIVAAKAHIDEVAFSDILNGKRKCPLENYVNICRVLGLPFDTFIVI